VCFGSIWTGISTRSNRPGAPGDTISVMTEEELDKAKATAAAGVGAGVGTAGGASIGVLELAAQGAATGLSAGLVIGLGALAGAALGLAGYGVYRNLKNKKKA
jgi:hypothetical protein